MNSLINIIETIAQINIYPMFKAWNIVNVLLFAFWLAFSFHKLKPKLGTFMAGFFAINFSFAIVSLIDEFWFIANIDLMLNSPLYSFFERWGWKIFYLYFVFKYSRQYFGDLINIRSKKFILAEFGLALSALIPIFFFKPYNIKDYVGAPYPLWVLYIFGDILQWSLSTLGFVFLWKGSPRIPSNFFYGLKEYYRMWKWKIKTIKRSNKLNLFKSKLFYEMIRQTASKFGLKFNASPETREDNPVIMKMVDGDFYYEYEDIPQVHSTIDKIFTDKVYGRRPKGIVIDIGAHVGVYSRYASAFSKVFAIEPQINNFIKLKKNSNYHNIVPIKMVISSKDGHAKLYSSFFDSNCSITQEGRNDFSIVESMRLDSFIDKFIPRKYINLIKIDAEGAEMEILKSGEKYLKNGRIMGVVIASYHYNGEHLDVEKYLKRMGFSVMTDMSKEIVTFGIKTSTPMVVSA
jgi:FkbM family methyltransferase